MNIGIDIGSREVKVYYIDTSGKGVQKQYSTIQFYQQFGSTGGGVQKGFLDTLSENSGVSFDKRDITVTGYGRNNIGKKRVTILSEIEAHARGAVIQTGFSDFTLLDIGGQDIKVIAVKGGVVEDFVMNDKCAAGTGRYLEHIAKILDIPVADMARYTKDPIELSHTCAIFGETEIVTRIAEGCSIEGLCSGANRSAARRIVPLLHRFNANRLVIVGGVAKNSGVIHFISQETAVNSTIPSFPQYNGAIGCCGGEM